MRSSIISLATTLLFAALPAGTAHGADQPLRFIDTHSHLLPKVTPDDEIALFKKAGVSAVVLMSSNPDELLPVAKKHAGYVIPFVGFSRSPNGDGISFNADTATALGKLHDAGAICGFGEIGTTMDPPTDPTPAATLLNPNRLKIYELAAKRRVPLNSHVDLATPDVIEAFGKIASMYPDMPLILAHAGFNAGPEVVGPLLAAHTNIYVDVSIRLEPLNGWGSPATPGPNGPNRRTMLDANGALTPAWRRLFEQHPDRFMFAMDITASGGAGREQRIGELVEIARKALSVLPRTSQEAIAHGNFEKLVRGCAAGLK